MIPETLARWHQLVRDRDVRGLPDLLADEVVFHSPVVHTPQQGKAVTLGYLQAAFTVLANDSFHYVRELYGERNAILEFEVEIGGVYINGVDMIRWNEHGQIVDFKVMLRPLKALQLIQQQMAAMLQAQASG